MEDLKFKRKHKPPACTQAPWKYLIKPYEREKTLRKIREECKDIYLKSFDICPKLENCNGKTCIGRPLPWDSETAKPFLDKLKKTQKIINNELFVEDCSNCEIKNLCKNTCKQVNNFIDRHKTKEPPISYKEVDNFVKLPKEEQTSVFFTNSEDIPWEVLSETRRNVIKEYLYNIKDFRIVSAKFKLNNQARAKYEFYSGLNKLAEYGVMRKFLTLNKNNLTKKQKLVTDLVYFENNNLTKVSKLLGISRQAVSQIIDLIIKKHKIKWPKYVEKVRGKLVYSTLELFK